MPRKSHKTKPISANRVVITSFLVDVSDVVVNLIVSVITGSVVIRAEFLQGTADMIGSALLIIGVKRSRRAEDPSHPFGFGKEVYFWSLLSAIVMVTVASSFSLYFGYQRFLNPSPVRNIALALGLLVFSTCTNGYAVSLSYRRLLGRKSLRSMWHTLHQTPQVATKTALVQDTMGTLSSITGLVALLLYVITGYTAFDGIGAMVTGILLLVLALFLIHGLRDFVVGKSASDAVMHRIRAEVLTVPEVQDILDLKTMIIGSNKLLVNIEVHLQDHLTTDQIEKLIDRIKEEVQEDVPSVKYIHVELESPDGE